MENVEGSYSYILRLSFSILVLAVGTFAMTIDTDTFRPLVGAVVPGRILTILVSVDMHEFDEKINITVIYFALAQLPGRIAVHLNLRLLLYPIII